MHYMYTMMHCASSEGCRQRGEEGHAFVEVGEGVEPLEKKWPSRKHTPCPPPLAGAPPAPIHGRCMLRCDLPQPPYSS